MMEAVHTFQREKNHHKQQFIINVIMGCNCADISHKAVYSHHSWSMLLKCQRFSTTESMYTHERAPYMHSLSNGLNKYNLD